LIAGFFPTLTNLFGRFVHVWEEIFHFLWKHYLPITCAVFGVCAFILFLSRLCTIFFGEYEYRFVLPQIFSPGQLTATLQSHRQPHPESKSHWLFVSKICWPSFSSGSHARSVRSFVHIPTGFFSFFRPRSARKSPGILQIFIFTSFFYIGYSRSPHPLSSDNLRAHAINCRSYVRKLVRRDCAQPSPKRMQDAAAGCRDCWCCQYFLFLRPTSTVLDLMSTQYIFVNFINIGFPPEILIEVFNLTI